MNDPRLPCFWRRSIRVQRLLLALAVLALALHLGGRAAAPTPVRADAAGDQAYADALSVPIADIQSNLDSVRFYLPLASRADPTDPTWQLVSDAGDAIDADAGSLALIDPPDAYMATHAALIQTVTALADSLDVALNAYMAGTGSAGDAAMIDFNDALVQYETLQVALPGDRPPPVPAVAPLDPPASTLTPGDGSTAAGPVALGATVTDAAGWQVSVARVSFDAWQVIAAANLFNEPPPPHMRMVLITVSATNTTGAPATLRYADLALTGASGTLLLPFAAQTSCGFVPNQLDAAVAAGATAQGNVCFIVPAAKTNLELVTNAGLQAADARFLALQ